MDTVVDVICAPPTPPAPRGKKRRLVVDTLRAIPNSEFKQQLQNTSDIVGKPELAPATKKAMHFLTYGGVGKFFAYPGRRILSNNLAKLFFSHLTMTTEVKNGPDDGKVEPLDPELRTPSYSPGSVSVHTGVYHMFGDPVAKRNANSFDYLIKGMHIRPNLMKSKESRKRPVVDPPVVHNQVVHRTHHHHHHHQQHHSSSASGGGGDNNVPVFEIVNMKSEQEMHHSLSSVVLAPVEGMTEDTMLVGLDCNFDSTNNKIADDMNTEIIPDVSNLEGIKQEGGLVYTIAADQSVVIKGENHGMDDNVLYFITL